MVPFLNKIDKGRTLIYGILYRTIGAKRPININFIKNSVKKSQCSSDTCKFNYNPCTESAGLIKRLPL